ncbi:hypothetical protein NPIL_360861, partial [Nephila pilipes]
VEVDTPTLGSHTCREGSDTKQREDRAGNQSWTDKGSPEDDTGRLRMCGEGTDAKHRGDEAGNRRWTDKGTPVDTTGPACWSEGRSMILMRLEEPEGFGNKLLERLEGAIEIEDL